MRRGGGRRRRKRVEELTRITKTPKRQRALLRAGYGEERGESRDTRGRRKGLFINEERTDRESAVSSVLGEKRATGSRSRGRNSPSARCKRVESVGKMCHPLSFFLFFHVRSERSFLMPNKMIPGNILSIFALNAA